MTDPALDLNDLLVRRPAATFFMRAAGDAMIDEGIRDGDLLVVDRSLSPADGDVVVASVDGEFVVRFYRKDAAGVRLEPANPDCPALPLRAGRTFEYFGKVTSYTHLYSGRQRLEGTPCGSR